MEVNLDCPFPWTLSVVDSQAGETLVETSILWKRTLGQSNQDPHVERLVVSLRDARKQAKHLTTRVASALPGLTIHDISHLDALWDVADIIAGDDFPLNPLEAYVFGCAVLLHDAGLCFEAFSGGQAAIRETVRWRDARRRLASSGLVEDVDREADFEALRGLHANQAERLAVSAWEDGHGSTVYMINDTELREHYGPLIGQIAASHHWDIEDVTKQFAEPRPPAPFLAPDWSVDALKVACLLRVADAGHIDGLRAPTFLLKILQMNCLSRDHWVAQNHLGRLMVSPQDPTLLLVSSMSPFTQAEARAWWVAFDAIVLLDKEIKDCNDLLTSAAGFRRPRFARTRVAGAGRASETAKHVQTVGWEPTDSDIHVSDVAALVSSLGGENLYGKDVDRLEIALRELIQNASDAIIARRAIDKSYDRGQVTVRLIQETNAPQILQIDDDGAGMSQTTMVKDMLDFGKSFWASERAAQEFPGLHSSGYSSIGRFGIGFFSVFMAASKVNVFSRRHDAGIMEVRCLSFNNGVSLRPILSNRRPNDMHMDTTTRIEIELKPGVLNDPNQVPIRTNQPRQRQLLVSLRDYAAALVSGLDVPVTVEFAATSSQVHGGFPPRQENREQWLRTVSYITAGVNQGSLPLVSAAAPRLREIRDEDGCYGLAAIAVSQPPLGSFLSMMSVGGIGTPHHPQQNESFVGLIDHLPANAQRAPGEIAAPKHTLEKWLSEQVELLSGQKISDLDRLYASYSLCQFDYDPREVLRAILVRVGTQHQWLSLSELSNILRSGARLVFPTVVLSERILDPHVRDLPTANNMFACIAVRTGTFNDAELIDGVPRLPKSLIGVVHGTLVNDGHNPTWHIHRGTYRSLFEVGDFLEVTV